MLGLRTHGLDKYEHYVRRPSDFGKLELQDWLNSRTFRVSPNLLINSDTTLEWNEPELFYQNTDDTDIWLRPCKERRLEPSLMILRYHTSNIGQMPQFCYPITTPVDSKLLLKYILQERADLSNDFPQKYNTLVSNLFDVDKDPETLDDSDIEALDDMEMCGDCGIAREPRIELKSLEEIEQKHSSLIVSNNGIFQTGNTSTTNILQGLFGSIAIKPNKVASLILLTQPSGHLLSLLPLENGKETYLLQYWNLGQKGQWNIIKHQNEKQFVLIHKELGFCKFFEFHLPFTFQLVNNLTLTDSVIMNGSFFPTTYSDFDPYFIIFITAIRYDRVVYFVIEWNNNEIKKKEVYQLTVFDGEKTNMTVPIGLNACLVETPLKFSLVSANQIMSGETEFHSFQLKALKGIRSFFPAPLLLSKLQKLDPDTFKKFQYCTIISSSTGNICFCVTERSTIINRNLKFYELTRFKGLKFISSLPSNPINLDPKLPSYALTVISFSRTLELTLTLKDLKCLNTRDIIKPLKNITFKHTVDSSTEENSQILAFTSSKIYNTHTGSNINDTRNSQVWLTSPNAITQPCIDYKLRKTHQIVHLKQFQIFNHLKIWKCKNFNVDLLHRLGIKHSKTESSLIFATDTISNNKMFLLDLTMTTVAGADESVQGLVDIEDLLCDAENETLFLDFTKKNLIQITKNTIYIDPIDADRDLIKISPGWEFENVACNNGILIAWNAKLGQISYIENIDGINDSNIYAQPLINSKCASMFLKQLRTVTNINFEIKRSIDDPTKYDIWILLRDRVIRTSFSNWMTDTIDFSEEYSPNFQQALINGHHFCTLDHESFFQTYNLGNDRFKKDFTCTSRINFQDKDLKLRKFGENRCLAFSSFEIFVINLIPISQNNELDFYKLKLPYLGNFNSILEVCPDVDNKLLFILYSDGLKVFELSYLTSNNGNFLLKSTRSKNKKFLYLNKINRMLVLNQDLREWECIRLSDGKAVSLDSQVLKDDAEEILEIKEIPIAVEDNPLEKKTILLITFTSSLKLVLLTAAKNKISNKIIDSYKLENSRLLDHLVVTPESEIFVLDYKVMGTDNEMSFSKLKVGKSGGDNNQENSTSLQITLKRRFTFKSWSTVKSFTVVGDNIVVTTNLGQKLYVIKDFSTSSNESTRVYPLEIYPDSKVQKIIALNECCFVVAAHCGNRNDLDSRLIFYSLPTIKVGLNNETGNLPDEYGNGRVDDIFEVDFPEGFQFGAVGLYDVLHGEKHTQNHGDDTGHDHDEVERVLEERKRSLLFWRNNSAKLKSPLRRGATIVYEDHVSSHCFEDISSILGSTAIRTKKLSPYNAIALDKPIQDMSYDPLAQTLYVLMTDQTIHKFAKNTLPYQDEYEHRWNSGYFISRRSLIKPDLICEAGLWNLSNNRKNTV
ncbi:mms1p [Saccharomyces arboricola H-6]|uniref:Mms1p n=1 Tax=Saccharomyces arboricola (strain H-6 / AS 2.3317 / CBS 10644) TaxID=1160507 RepID=J8LGR8_SACAR|nr:mms1p [Saccharomyces arboricola H-6]